MRGRVHAISTLKGLVADLRHITGTFRLVCFRSNHLAVLFDPYLENLNTQIIKILNVIPITGQGILACGYNQICDIPFFLTSSLRHPKILIKEFSYFLMPCHQHGLRINLLV